jgi:hypothetical protein
VWLDSGKVMMVGDTDEVLDAYEERHDPKKAARRRQQQPTPDNSAKTPKDAKAAAG